jgi:hypothetical protein
MPRRHSKMRGGFLDSITSGISSGWNSLSQGATDAYNKAKGTSTATATTTPSYTSPTPTYIPTGGRKKTRKHFRGGFKDNTPSTGLASTAASISGIKSAQPHNWVGGRTKRRRHIHSRRHRHSKSCRH